MLQCEERIIKKMDDVFTCFHNVMQEDLDRRQIGGGNLSTEILQERILQPTQDNMDSLETFIQTRVKGANNTERGSVDQISGGIIKMTSDNFTIGALREIYHIFFRKTLL